MEESEKDSEREEKRKRVRNRAIEESDKRLKEEIEKYK